MKPGVYFTKKKNGDEYYRSSITYKGKHISLGSYEKESSAFQAYQLAACVLSDSVRLNIDNYPNDCILSFHKWIVLINFRDNNIYFKNPIYLRKSYFLYYLNCDTTLKFDADDLFYYSHHKIIQRGGHLFVSEYGMQVSILARYNIKNYAVAGRDYLFANGDHTDFRYANIRNINQYYGVSRIMKKGLAMFLVKIHINGDFIIGCYATQEEAAIAYNKAVLLLRNKGIRKNYQMNYIDGMDEITYAAMYQRIRISKKITDFPVNC